MAFLDEFTAHSALIRNNDETNNRLTIAVSAHWYTFPEKFDWVTDNGLALEYSPDPVHMEQISGHLDPYIESGTPVRYHAYFPGYEIGDVDRKRAEQAVKLHFKFFELIQNTGQQYVTVHVGLKREIPLDFSRIAKNLKRLVDHARKRNIVVCLENLRKGPASSPEQVLSWAENSGALITMDIGHAVSSDQVQNGQYTAAEIVDFFSARLAEVHFYERETDIHHAPKDMEILGPIIDRLIMTPCRWWTIELDDPDQILHTRDLVVDYL